MESFYLNLYEYVRFALLYMHFRKKNFKVKFAFNWKYSKHVYFNVVFPTEISVNKWKHNNSYFVTWRSSGYPQLTKEYEIVCAFFLEKRLI